MNNAAEPGLKIATVAERTGVGVHTLRAWERRYGIPRPSRSSGHQRLYSDEDVRRVLRVVALANEGVAPAQAAARVLSESFEAAPGPGRDEVDALFESLAMLDERAAIGAWNWLVDRHDVNTLIEQCIVPALRRIGAGWASGDVSIDQEHFATAFLSSRLSGLARQASPPAHPLVVLACPAGETHELPLQMAGVLIRYRGVNTVLLGANTPSAAVAHAVEQTDAVAAAIPAFSPETAREALKAARAVGKARPGTTIILGGPGFATAGTLPPGASIATTLTDTADRVRQAAWGQ